MVGVVLMINGINEKWGGKLFENISLKMLWKKIVIS